MEPKKNGAPDPTDYLDISDLRLGVEKSLRDLQAGDTSASKATSGLERVTRGHAPRAEEIRAIHPYLDGIIAALSQPEFRGKLVDLLSDAEDRLMSRARPTTPDDAELPAIKTDAKDSKDSEPEATKKESIEEAAVIMNPNALTAILKASGAQISANRVVNVLGQALAGKGLNAGQVGMLQPVLKAMVDVLKNPSTRPGFNTLVAKSKKAAATPAPAAIASPAPAAKAAVPGAAPAPKAAAPAPGAAPAPRSNVNAPAAPAGTPLKSSYVYESDYNPEDTVTVNMPLFLRLMEYAKEDAQTDMDLHKVTEKLIKLSEHGDTLTMNHYDDIVSEVSDDDSHKDLGEGWWDQDGPDYGDDDDFNHRRFARRGSALHAADDDNPRTLPCPTCGCPNRLTRLDKMRGYQCDSCADAMERGDEIRYCDDHDHDMSENVLESITECGAWGNQGGEEVQNSYNVTKTTTSKGATVTVTANATELSELQRIMKLAGLDQALMSPPAAVSAPADADWVPHGDHGAEPAISEPLGVIKAEVVPQHIEPEFDHEADMGSMSYTTNANTLKSMLVNKMRNKLSY